MCAAVNAGKKDTVSRHSFFAACQDAGYTVDDFFAPSKNKSGRLYRELEASIRIAWVGIKAAKRLADGSIGTDETMTILKDSSAYFGKEMTKGELRTFVSSIARNFRQGYATFLKRNEPGTPRNNVRKGANAICHNLANARDRLQVLTITQNDNLTDTQKDLIVEIGSVKRAGELVAALNMALALFSPAIRKAEGVKVPRVDIPAKRRAPKAK